MITIGYTYSGKHFSLAPYNTNQEKQLLLIELMGVEDKLNTALRILGQDDETINSLSEQEKIAMVYKYRTISIGDEVSLRYKCVHCETPNEKGIDINDLVTSSNITNENIIDVFKPVTEENIHEFINADIDEMDLDEYETIADEIRNSVTRFNFIRPDDCIKCKKTNYINIENDALKYISEDTIMSLYQIYNDLTFFGKYTKQDIDTLIPFERSILISLLNKTREELNKNNGR